MFEFGEGRTTRSSIRSLKGEAAVKYITRATLQRASGSEERKSGVLAKHNIANSKMNDQTKSSHSGISSISSELERNLSTRSEDEGFGSPSILPTIPTVLARPHHRLNQVTLCLLPTCNLQHEFLSLGASGTTEATHPSPGLKTKRFKRSTLSCGCMCPLSRWLEQ